MRECEVDLTGSAVGQWVIAREADSVMEFLGLVAPALGKAFLAARQAAGERWVGVAEEPEPTPQAERAESPVPGRADTLLVAQEPQGIRRHHRPVRMHQRSKPLR